MPDSRMRADGRVVAAALFDAAPTIILCEPAEPRDRRPADVAQSVVEVLQGCLHADEVALKQAVVLLGDAREAATPPEPERAAAADLLLRAVALAEDDALKEFVLVEQQARFDIPPVVRAVTDQFPVPSGSPLSDADALACRHLMGSTVAELAAIRSALPGLAFVEVLGKPYSANRLAMLGVERLGIRVDDGSCDMPEPYATTLGSYAAVHRASARAAVDRYLANSHPDRDRPLLVVDDGGALIDAVGQAVAAGRIRQPVAAIEQTTHGLFAVQGFTKEPYARRHGFACVSVARSEAKLRRESPLIAASVVETLESWMRYLDKPIKNVGIVGIGAVGAAVAKELMAKDIVVRVHDKNPNKLAVTELLSDFEIAWTLSDLLQHSDVVIGASGGTSIDAEAAECLRDGTVLISASSGDLEFSGLRQWSVRLRPILAGTTGPTVYDLSHGLLEATPPPGRPDDRRVYVANRGFPINFDGGCDPIEVRHIQLTRALIVGAVLQAAGAVDGVALPGRSGVFPLHRAVDRFVIGKYDELATT